MFGSGSWDRIPTSPEPDWKKFPLWGYLACFVTIADAPEGCGSILAPKVENFVAIATIAVSNAVRN